MSLIQKKETKTTVKKSVQFEEDVFKDIDAYLKFIGMEENEETRNYVIGEALKFLFIRDKEFQIFKKNSIVEG
jgi:hypothetical protein